MTKKNVTQIAKSIFFAAVFLFSQSAISNTKYNNGDVYDIVVKDDGKDTEAPGIYAISAKNNGVPVLILKGHVLGVSRAMKGIRALGASTQARDAITILNGRITLFNHNTNEKNQKSYIQFGSEKSVPVVDILNGRVIQIPLIEDAEGFSLFKGPSFGLSNGFAKDTQLYLFSIRSQTVLGSGLTFAVLVNTSNKDDKVSVVNNSAILIAHDFYEESQLSRLRFVMGSNKHPMMVIPSLVESIQAQLGKIEFLTQSTQGWIEQMERYLTYVKFGKVDAKNPGLELFKNPEELYVGVPLYDLQSSRPDFTEVPIELISNQQFNKSESPANAVAIIGQVYDPFSQKFSLVDLTRGTVPNIKVVKGNSQAKGSTKTDAAYIIKAGLNQCVFHENEIGRDSKGRFLIYPDNKFASADSYKEIVQDVSNSFLFTDGDGASKIAVRNRNGTYEVFGVPGTNADFIKPDDKAYLITSKIITDPDGRNLVTFFISVQKKNAKSSAIYAVIAEYGHTVRPLSVVKIHSGDPMSASEMLLRIQDTNDDLLFDNITPVQGPGVYLKSYKKSIKANNESSDSVDDTLPVGGVQKTVPYLRIFATVSSQKGNQNGAQQRYLRPLVERELYENFYYRQYDLTGAEIVKSGFYLKLKDHLLSAKGGGETFLSGRPLFSRKREKNKEEMTHVLDTVRIYSSTQARQEAGLPPAPPMYLHLVPYSPRIRPGSDTKAPPKENEFVLAVALTPESYSSASASFEGALGKADIRYPYKSLSYTKVILGTKSRANEAHILLFFNKSSDVEGSQDVVVSITARTRIDKVPGAIHKSVLELTDAKVLHRGLVQESELKNHLRVDAEGGYYWLVDPSLTPESSRYAVRRISNPEEKVSSRKGSMSVLREPENIKDLSSSGGHLSARHGGRWEIHSEYNMRDRMHGAAVIFDQAHARKSKEQSSKDGEVEEEKSKPKREDEQIEKMLFSAFGEYLDGLATPRTDENNKVQVILVEQGLKEKFRSRMVQKLATDRLGKFYIGNPNFHLFYADKSLDDVEVGEEFLALRAFDSSQSKLLLVEQELLHGDPIYPQSVDNQNESEELLYDDYGVLISDEKSKAERLRVFKHDKDEDAASWPILLATGGEAKTLRGYKRLKALLKPIPSVILATPDEWREIQAKNEVEQENGIFEHFNLNSDYLTSSWTTWPPNTEKAAEDMKQLPRLPYNVEEMKVFPTLDRLLNQAASGELKGKQKIVIVAPELIPIVSKLINLRWATMDANAAQPWNFSNRDLALYRINVKDVSQSAVIDNFRSIKGAAANRHAVLFSDLESVLRVGRPTNNMGRNFTIRDPIKADNNSLIAQAGAEMMAQIQVVEYSEEDKGMLEELRYEISQAESAIQERHEFLRSMRREEYTSQAEYSIAQDEVRAEIEEAIVHREDYLEQVSDIEQKYIFASNGEPTSTEGEKHYPHMLWWVAAEGQQIQPKRQKGWDLATSAQRDAATILIGTEEQLVQIEADMEFEGRFFDIRKHFEVEHLQSPDEKTKFSLIDQLFNRPEIKALGISFALNHETGRDPRSQLIYQFINRVDQLAYDQKVEKTTAFVKAFIVLKQSLSEDINLRRTRLIDQKYIERLFRRVFPMQLDVDILEDNDPLKLSHNVDQAVRNLQKAGYTGSPDLKRRFLGNILSQTRTTDTSRPIPNSQILFGGTSIGKTFLLEKYFETVGLVEYNSNRANNENADYIMVKVGDLTEEATTEPSKMSVDKMIENVLDLLSSPKGPRAHIVIDDFHKATSTGVRSKVFRFIQGIFEARNGRLLVRSKDGKRVREIPIQNLNIYMTLNPSSNQRIRRTYIDSDKMYQNDTAAFAQSQKLKQEVLAAISDANFTPEESELARWADIINMDNFPRSAKVPELGKRVRESSRTSANMMLVDPQVIDSLVEKFADANARELLSPAAAALTTLPFNASDARLYTVTLRDNAKDIIDREFGATGYRTGQVNLHELQSAVRELTQIDPVQMQEPKSLIRFMSFVLQNFRLQVFNEMALEAHISDTLLLDRPGMRSLLKVNFLIGTATHVLDRPSLPTSEVSIKTEDIPFYNRAKQEEFYDYFTSLHSNKFFPKNFGERAREQHLDLNNFLRGTVTSMQEAKSRKEVISQYVEKVHAALIKSLMIYLRLSSPDELRNLPNMSEAQIRRWFEALKEKNPEEPFKAATQDLLNLFMDFESDLNSPELTDFRSPESPDLTIYDEVRLFSFIVDKAITQLPWASIAKFTYDIVDSAADFELGTKTAYKEFVGTHSISPFAITTPEFMNEMLDIGMNVQTNGDNTQPRMKLAHMRDEFDKNCIALLKGE